MQATALMASVVPATSCAGRRLTLDVRQKKTMKITILLLAVLALVSSTHAGIVGLFTSTEHDWAFVQKTGGMRIQTPIPNGAYWMLPVEYDISGLTTVTTTPTQVNSGMVVRKIDIDVIGTDLILKVISQAREKGKRSGLVHFVTLPKLGSGVYDVYYGSRGDAQKYLGKIEMK